MAAVKGMLLAAMLATRMVGGTVETWEIGKVEKMVALMEPWMVGRKDEESAELMACLWAELQVGKLVG